MLLALVGLQLAFGSHQLFLILDLLEANEDPVPELLIVYEDLVLNGLEFAHELTDVSVTQLRRILYLYYVV